MTDTPTTKTGTNRVELEGTLVRILDHTVFGTGTEKAVILLRVPTEVGDTAVPVVIWSPPAWLPDTPTGSRIALSASVRQRTWNGPAGSRKYRTEIVANDGGTQLPGE